MENENATQNLWIPGKTNADGSEHKIYKVCLTGGPCAGKTSSMNYLKEKFAPEYIVYVIPETAANTVGAGVTIIPSEFTPQTHKVFTQAIMQQQLNTEQYFYDIATIQKKSVIILCDRGVMDNTAYCTPEVEQKIYAETGWTKTNISDNNYDMVIHLVTAADGAAEFYTLENNAARTEGPELAKMLDKMTQGAWNGHPNYV
jgi:thymidylate kinase